MSTIHHGFAIAVAEFDLDRTAAAFEKVREFARELDENMFTNAHSYEGLLVGPVDSVVNLTQTYFMAPDGSKEGWAASDAGDALRTFFINTMADAGASVASGSFGELQDTFKVGRGVDSAGRVMLG